MGYWTDSITRIPTGAGVYVIVLEDPYKNTAQRVVSEQRDAIAAQLPKADVIVQLGPAGSEEARAHYSIPKDADFPVVVFTDKHPLDWTKGDDAIVVHLGKLRSEDEIKRFFHRVASALHSDDFRAAKWEWRRARLRQSADGLNALVQIILAGVGLGK